MNKNFIMIKETDKKFLVIILCWLFIIFLLYLMFLVCIFIGLLEIIVEVIKQLGILILAFTAIAVPFIQDFIRKKNDKKTDLKIVDNIGILQGYKNSKKGRDKYFRLIIENKGETTAFDVEPYLWKIEGRENSYVGSGL